MTHMYEPAWDGAGLVAAMQAALPGGDAGDDPTHDRQLLGSSLAQLPAILYRCDENGVIRESVGAGLARLGRSQGQSVGRPIQEVDPANVAYYIAALEGRQTTFQARGVADDDPLASWAFEVHLIPLQGGGFLGFAFDATDRARQEEALRRSLYADPLTGLYSRTYLTEWLAERAATQGDGLRATLLYMDIVGFREVNEVFGYGLGDEILRACAERLTRIAPPGGLVARIGDDSFAILLEGSTDRSLARQLAADMIAVIETPYVLQGEEVNASCNVGVVILPDHVSAVDRLFRAAEMTLTKAVGLGRGEYAFYSADLERRVQSNRQIATSIRRGLADSRFRLVYQPKVDAVTGRILGVEALLRVDGEEGGTAPETMIRVAENTRLIEPIGAWALDEAARRLAEWRAQGHQISVAVNVSAVQMRHAMQPTGLINVVRDCLGDIRAPASALEIEVTESVFMDARSRQAMSRLRELGATMVVDDFGTGWSSFSYLKDLRPNAIKIDRSFVGWTGAGMAEFAICRSLIELGHALDMRVIAEGVETLEQALLLRDAGCNELQGFLFSTGVPAEEIDAMLRDGAPFSDLMRG